MSSVSTTDAIRELERRGVDNPERFTSTTTPGTIVEQCKLWDTKQNVGPGLLVKMLRDAHADESVKEEKAGRREQLRARFNAVAEVFQPGEVTESHRRIARRRWPDDNEDCQGVMVVTENDWPSLMATCDACGFEVAYPARALSVLPDRPPIPARRIP